MGGGSVSVWVGVTGLAADGNCSYGESFRSWWSATWCQQWGWYQKSMSVDLLCFRIKLKISSIFGLFFLSYSIPSKGWEIFVNYSWIHCSGGVIVTALDIILTSRNASLNIDSTWDFGLYLLSGQHSKLIAWIFSRPNVEHIMKNGCVNEHSRSCSKWYDLFCCCRSFDPVLVYPSAVHDSHLTLSHASDFFMLLMTCLA